MNFEFESRAGPMKMMDTVSYDESVESSGAPYSAPPSSSTTNQFDYLIHDTENVDTIAVEGGGGIKCSSENNEPPRLLCRSNYVLTSDTIQQSMASTYLNINGILSTSSGSNNYMPRRSSRSNPTYCSSNISTNVNSGNACSNGGWNCAERNVSGANSYNTNTCLSSNKFQYILMAPTSPGVKISEDTLTYLNQGQNYELKMSCAADVLTTCSSYNEPSGIMDEQYGYLGGSDSNNTLEDIKPLIHKSSDEEKQQRGLPCCSNGQLAENGIVKENIKYESGGGGMEYNDLNYLSVIRLCFWDRKLQENEQEEIKEVSVVSFDRSYDIK
jgi:hypothetical protein